MAVLGLTAGGLTAALRLARAGHKVVVAGCLSEPTECPLADWLAADLVEHEPALKGVLKAAGATPFTEIRFYNTEDDRTACHSGRRTLGYFLPAGALVAALMHAARAAGATVIDQPCDLSRIELGEDAVTLAGPHPQSARVLLMACGRPVDAAARLGMSVRNVPRGVLIATGIDAACAGPKAAKCLDKALHVVHLSRDGDLALAFAVGSTVHMRLVQPLANRLEAADTAAALPATLHRVGVLPADIALRRPHAACWLPPDAVALDLEDHVAKRTLLIGTAGGFVDRVTAQTLRPTMHSAVLGADVAHKALAAREVQATLNTFNTAWRRDLADALRPPHTATGMLLPLVFSNRQMVARFAQAMLVGQAI